MPLRTRSALAALAIAFTSAVAVPAVIAQTQPPAQSDQDHKAHHPDGKAPDMQATPPATPQMGGQSGGMMCGDMKQMMSMMQDMHTMMSMHAGMMSAQIEADIAKLKIDLKITDAQAPHWNRFADALRKLARSTDSHQQTMTAAATLPARLARMESAMLANLNSVRALEEALQPLYAALSDEQKKLADGIRVGPMGMM